MIKIVPLAMAVAMAVGASGASAASAPNERLAAELLQAHNAERAAFGLRPLAWDPALAGHAGRYADELARINDLRHSPKELRRGQGENLWMGSARAFSPRTMVQNWASEKNVFRPGVFPNNSGTRSWSDVGHYTQIIWPGTTHVGCGISSNRGNDFLVCRYSPPGNVTGQRVP